MARKATKKTAAKKVKKTASKQTKKAVKAKKINVPAIKNKQNKAEIIAQIAEDTRLTQKQVRTVFASLNRLVQAHMVKGGSGEFTVPDIGLKVKRVLKGARKERKGRNPATGKPMIIPAKPATLAIKVLPLKSLRDVVEE